MINTQPPIKGLASCNTFTRFLLVPAVLSLIFSVTSFLFVVTYTILLVKDKSIWWYGAGGLVCFIIFPLVIIPTTTEINRMMIKERLWLWGRHKFDDWNQFSEWVGKTHHLVLEHIAGLSDDKWQPNVKNGGINNDR